MGSKLDHVVKIGTLELVNCLIVITNNHDVWFAFVNRMISESANHSQLGLVGILVFVD